MVAQYEEIEAIGSGSFGKVFRGRNLSTNEYVALKKISKGVGGHSEQEIRGLLQECEIQMNLYHPNIVQMLDWFQTEDAVIVVTELAKEDLSKVLAREGRLQPKDVEKIACHLVSALHFLHSHRILHRDIKPQNILIGWDGNVKLCDFGFARTMGISTYMLTSVKGTPLYMAPEIVEGKPYDHNADLWALGCILYELIVGTPPFFTTSLKILMDKILKHNITWPAYITGERFYFLRGLLEKNPQTRLTWPALLTHPYVRKGVRVDPVTGPVQQFSLTRVLSPAQELEKEKQRLLLQVGMTPWSLDRPKAKAVKGKKHVSALAAGVKSGQRSNGGSAKTIKQAGTPDEAASSSKTAPVSDPSSNCDVETLRQMLHCQTLGESNQASAIGQPSSLPPSNQRTIQEVSREVEGDSTSSCETMTSSSEFDGGEDSASDSCECSTIVMASCEKREGGSQELSTSTHVSCNPMLSQSLGSVVWKSGALLTVDSFGSEDKAFDSLEWIPKILDLMKQTLECPRSLCDKEILVFWVSLLGHQGTEPEVVEHIAKLFSFPFTFDDSIHETEPGLVGSLQTLYFEAKVLPNLLYACQLIVHRRVAKHGSLHLDQIPGILTSEDLEALEKCVMLIVCLLLEDEDFVTQFCDSVYILKAHTLIQLFLKLDRVRSELTANTVAVLCHTMRVSPTASIVEKIVFDNNDRGNNEHSELWRLMSHTNPSIKARALRLFAYLSLNSVKVRTEILGKHKPKLWTVLRRNSIAPESELRETAEFVLKALSGWFTPDASRPNYPQCLDNPLQRSPQLVLANSEAGGISEEFSNAETELPAHCEDNGAAFPTKYDASL